MDSSALSEAAMADTSMRDASMIDPMEDLFGDAAAGLDVGVGVGLSSSLPPPPSLLRRLAEMNTSGCCTKLAWSNSGSIARISSDGHNISFRAFLRDIKIGKWSLGEENQHPLHAPDGSTFVHLHFNHVGQDLAVVDDLGIVHLYSMSGGNGRMHRAAVDLGTDQARRSLLDAAIGLHWLPIFPLDCRSVYISPASKDDGFWTSVSKQRDPDAVRVHHPADNNRALLSISRSCTVSLHYQQDGWRVVSKDTGSFTSSHDIVSHADFCEHDGITLLVTFDLAKRIRLYSVSITWNATSVPGPNNVQHVKTVAPTLQVVHLASLANVAARHAVQPQLSLLRLIPAVADIVDQTARSLTTLLATFTYASLPTDPAHQLQDSSTTFVRWQIETEYPLLHESFKKLKPSGSLVVSRIRKTVLRRQPDLVTEKIILSVQSHYFDTIIACVASDGTVDFRDRATFSIIEPFADTTYVSSLPQTGFEYLPGDHSTHVAISADGSAMALVRQDGTVDSKIISLRYGWQAVDDGITDSGALAEAAIVCLARQFMILTCSNVLPDEVISPLPPELPVELQQLFVREVFRLTRYSPDISGIDEKSRQTMAVKEPLLPRGFSVQLTLGTRLDGRGRTMPGQLAWAVLNLRYIATWIPHSIIRLDPAHPFPSDMVHSVRGLCRWGMDIIIYILQALLTIRSTAEPNGSSKTALEAVCKQMRDSNSPAVLLLLCSFPRALLKVLVTFLPRLIKLSQISAARARSVLERQELVEIGLLETTSPFKFDAFKNLLDEVDSIFQPGQSAKKAKTMGRESTLDVLMTLTGAIPEQLGSKLQVMIVSAIPIALDTADTAKIYFADTRWLGLSGPESIELARRYDVLRKTPLPKGAAVRRCRRCGSLMEELNLEKPREIMPWLVNAQRHCVCTCNWYVP